VNGARNPTVFAPEIPEFVRDPAKRPIVSAPIRMSRLGKMTLFTPEKEAAAGWLKNYGTLGSKTMGLRAETVGSYLAIRTTGPIGGRVLL